MEPSQEAELIGGGDCRSHWHSEDRVPTQDFLHGLQNVSSIKYPLTSYSVDPKYDYHLVDTSGGVVTATLPQALNNRVIVFVRIAGPNNLVLTCSGTDTINGAASLTISSSYSPVRLLAVRGIGYIQV